MTDAGVSDEALLVDHTAWRRFDANLDPLSDHRPATLDCGIAGFYVLHGELEIDSNRCNYLLTEHPALRGVRKGQRVELELRHYDLEAFEPSEAHFALIFRDQVQWEIRIPIPHPAQVIQATFSATTDLSPGDPIRLHLHNHGQNTYAFTSLRAVDP